MRGKYVFIRPYCRGTEVIGAYQSSVAAVDNIWGRANLYHSICKNCGIVVTSYVKEPEKLLKKKDRR